MPIRIFGGGNKKIRDATATPEDVIKGKVFYNNNGRNVGSKESGALGFLKETYPNIISRLITSESLGDSKLPFGYNRAVSYRRRSNSDVFYLDTASNNSTTYPTCVYFNNEKLIAVNIDDNIFMIPPSDENLVQFSFYDGKFSEFTYETDSYIVYSSRNYVGYTASRYTDGTTLRSKFIIYTIPV